MSRDLERAGVVGPAKWLGLTVVGLDEFDDPVGEVVDGVELAVADESSFHDREPQLDLVEPRSVGRGAVQEHLGMVVEECLDGGVPWAERLSTMQCSCIPLGVCSTRSARKATKLLARVESVTQPATVPSCTLRAANKAACRAGGTRTRGAPGYLRPGGRR